MSFRLLPRAPTMRRICPGWPRRRIAGTGICRMPVRYCPVMLSGLAHDRFGRALGDDMAAMHPGARPHIDDPVGGADRLLVVLDDDDRVAEVAQPLQRLQQPRRCRAGASRSTARRAHRARRSARSRSARPAGCAGSRRPTTCPRRATGSGIRARHCCRKPSRSLISFRMRCGDLALARGQRRVDAGEPVAGLGDRQRRRPR